MSIQNLIQQFKQSSPAVKIAAGVLVFIWSVVLLGLIGGAVVMFERPTQASQPTPGGSAPIISLVPDTGSAGSSVTVAGQGWNPGSLVLIYLSPAETADYALASAVAGVDGSFTTTLVVPSDPRWQTPGQAIVVARAEDNQVTAQVPLNIVAPGDPLTGTPADTATPTPSPTATSATPPPPTATPQPGTPLARANADLNVRGGPGTGYPVLGLLRTGQSAEITGLSPDGGWWQIRFPGVMGERGWLAAQFVTALNAANVPVVQGPALPPTPVPPTATPVIITDWRGEYYANPNLGGSPALVRNDVALNFNWGGSAPAAGLPADNFSARWTRSLNLPAGLYRISLTIDDGARLWVDGGLVIDQWRDSSPSTYVADVQLSQGVHNFRIEYYERSGGAQIDLRWQRLDETSQRPQAVAGGPYTVAEGNSISLDGSRSTAAGGNQIERYEWDFNYNSDNFTVDAAGRYPQVTYPDGPAIYTVALRVVDNRGNVSRIATSQVTVLNVAPQVGAGGPYSGQAGTPVNFIGTAADSGSVDQGRLFYRWDFGDGSTAEGRTVSHSYNRAGTYTARLTVFDKDGAQASATTQVTIGSVNQPPLAVISGPNSGKVGENLSFSGSASTDSDGSITNYAWNFGDGATANGVNASHSYSQPGTYRVTLTVVDNGGTAASSAYTVQISAPIKTPPVANIHGPGGGLAGQPLSFSGSGSTDSDGSITGYSWNFGDGATATGVNVNHTYSAAGTYQVTLTVTDNDGLTGQASRSVVVDEIIEIQLPPSAVLAGPAGGLAGESLAFDAGGSSDPDGSIVSYKWDFGDGSPVETTTLPVFNHSYTTPGTYTVTVTVTDDDGLINTASQQVTINQVSTGKQ